MTITEVLDETARSLETISVPVGMTQQIAVPVMQAVGNIRACLEAIADQERKKQEQQTEE